MIPDVRVVVCWSGLLLYFFSSIVVKISIEEKDFEKKKQVWLRQLTQADHPFIFHISIFRRNCQVTDLFNFLLIQSHLYMLYIYAQVFINMLTVILIYIHSLNNCHSSFWKTEWYISNEGWLNIHIFMLNIQSWGKTKKFYDRSNCHQF